MRRIKLVLAVVALLVILMAMGAAPAMADRSNGGNSQTRLTVTQICSSGDIEIEGGDNTRIEINSRGGCKHGKHHHKHSIRHHRH
jgi:hypothetical protein